MTTFTSISAALPRRVLIVDDEEIIRMGLEEILKSEGFDVVSAPDAVQALEILSRIQVAAILSDQKMPVLTGLEFLAQAKHIQPNASRVLVTGVLDLGTVISAINKGEIFRFIVKPWLREELIVTVKNAVQRYELVCHNQELQATTAAMNEKLKHLNVAMECQVARVAEQNRLLEQANRAMAQNLQHSVELCLKTMQTFYPTLGSQARRVFQLCDAMAEGLKLSSEDRQVLQISAWLHDIGLMGVPRQLIRQWQQNPESLNEAERALIEQHPILGQELVSFVQHLRGIGTTIRAHHERFDGSGFPDHLRGENIPWLARLLAVAVYFAESNYDHAVTLEAIKQGAGSQFDPDAVRAFLRCLPQAVVPRKEREVLLSELSTGMVVANGIYTANGVLIVAEGQQLNDAFIEKVRNHNRVTPITQSLIVYC